MKDRVKSEKERKLHLESGIDALEVDERALSTFAAACKF
jgi:hypothetical protein